MFSTEKLTYTFPANGITAVHEVSLNFESGKLHALLGENGAGKSTLARICTGQLQADSGRIFYNGIPLHFSSACNGIAAGIVLVPQHPLLAAELTVWENLSIGLNPTRRKTAGFLHRKTTPMEVSAELEQYGIRLPILQKTATLDTAQLHWAAIGEALLKHPTVLFLDEPTASFSPQEIDHLYTILRSCAKTGMCVVTVTHRIREVLTYMDTAHILRNGKTVHTGYITSQTSAEELLQGIFGATQQDARTVKMASAANYTSFSTDTHTFQNTASQQLDSVNKQLLHTQQAKEGLVISHLTAFDGKHIRFSDVSLQARCGMITGVAGIKKQGLELLEDLLIQMHQPEQGTIHFNGKLLTELTRELIAYIPSKRLRRGIAHQHSIAENLYTRSRSLLYPYGIYSKKAAADWKHTCSFDIPRSWKEPVISLSGGMMQKLIFSRELDNPVPQLIICAEPYWGLDRKVQTILLHKLRTLADAGACVLVLTSDADAALETCDCIHILYGGVFTGFMDRQTYNRSALIAAMMQTDDLL